jgi:hypothetical protein
MALRNDYGPRPGDPGYHQGAPGAVGIAWGINTSDGAVSLDDEYGGRGGGSDGSSSGSGGGSLTITLSNEFTLELMQTYIDELLACAGDPRNIKEWGGSARASFGCKSDFDCNPNDENCTMCPSSSGGGGGDGGASPGSWTPSPIDGESTPEEEIERPVEGDTQSTPGIPKPPTGGSTQAPPTTGTPAFTPLPLSQTWGNGWAYQQGSFTGSGSRPTNYSLTTGDDWYVYNTWNDVSAQQSTWNNWAVVNPNNQSKPRAQPWFKFFTATKAAKP